MRALRESKSIPEKGLLKPKSEGRLGVRPASVLPGKVLQAEGPVSLLERSEAESSLRSLSECCLI